jgi:hypothetical protein
MPERAQVLRARPLGLGFETCDLRNARFTGPCGGGRNNLELQLTEQQSSEGC